MHTDQHAKPTLAKSQQETPSGKMAALKRKSATNATSTTAAETGTQKPGCSGLVCYCVSATGLCPCPTSSYSLQSDVVPLEIPVTLEKKHPSVVPHHTRLTSVRLHFPPSNAVLANREAA